MSVDLAVRIEPLDSLLFGDNRSARAGEDHILDQQDPSPITFYGAIGGRVAHCLGAKPNRWQPALPYLGHFAKHLEELVPKESAELLAALPADSQGRGWFPKPASLVIEGFSQPNGSRRFHPLGLLAPQPLAVGEVSCLGEAARLVGPSSKAEVTSGLWVDEILLQQVLTCRLERHDGSAVRSADDFWRLDARTGLAVSNHTGAAVEHHLFQRSYRAFQASLEETWSSTGFSALYRVLQDPGEQTLARWSGVGYFGGDRGRARFEFSGRSGNPAASTPPSGTLRDAVLAAAADSCGFFLYLVMPAVAGECRWPLDAAPWARTTGKALRVSGWNSGRTGPGPRPLRTLIPAGSTFFWRWPEHLGDEAARRDFLAERWLDSINPTLAAAGFGRVLPGVWRQPTRDLSEEKA